MKLEKVLIILTLSVVIILLSAVRIGEYFGSISSVPTPKNPDSSVPASQEEIKPLEQELQLTFDTKTASKDPFNDSNGPFYHDVNLATSIDGVNFAFDSLVLEKASVPDVVRLADSTLAIYAVDGSGRSKSGLMVAISKDEGQTWQQGSVQFDSLVPGAADPDVVVLPDGKIRLYFVVFEDVENKTVVPTNMVKSATSSDGVNFSLESGERLKYSNLTDPDVVKIGNSWFMYFSQGAKLLAAISSNGLSFKYQKDIRSLGSVSSTVKITEETYRQFYCNNGIKSATSIDGLSWKDDAGYRLKPGTKEFVCDPAPLKTEGDNWLMYYKVAKVSESKQ
ncbi:MAG: hypothetical protein A3F33_03080 [Candidatus Woykebacteria bacterium RIFCSPHIGHO2_12_FULL_43_10]|uniref:Sialidase domain-containing protein n=2 Tax=Candidatus Woykeibacteriota TaxID=1817899 RepID=A0A1G1WXI4_9BACT|nr:MAG: hypothetical protein A2802_01700 [Candidatus Woykebacteria bacterium RIFCSPHIGHO2_01_FULL_43_29]OGY28728.1 MAG: hypothetical protein A3J50_01280 [Candidatus Woykebacteria bacterium RIFCSPHIGHO2_02_FULL_43_16b]OGY29803.1 MAG: hypothetical protein A3F33_03080 [Candidatus Woykebacteria bacterium RIFCSPHIGHO2_12_FULL_43_10]OGY32478.1 MAG: hypothetical protein A3A61_00805 [Candidatus Woykebacteria bacterium RIFCSPLOWO2_01_FULL_43_14]